MRIHARLAFLPAWIRIWTYVRGLDASGSGRVQLPVSQLLQLADRKSSTLYELLRRGREAGAFRKYRIRKGILTLYFSSLFKLCERQELDNWGAVGEAPLETEDLRAAACEIETQALQKASAYVARKSLSRQERKYLKVYSVDDILGKDASPGATAKPTSVKAPIRKSKQIIHRGHNEVFVGEDFIPYGVSQSAIAAGLGCCDRTVRNRLANVSRKQVLQTKPAYRLIAQALKFGQMCCGSEETYISELADGSLRLYERNGASKASRPGGHPIHPNRFFTDHMGRTWLSRCNLYKLDHELTSMRFARRQFENSHGGWLAAEGLPPRRLKSSLPGAGITPTKAGGDM